MDQLLVGGRVILGVHGQDARVHIQLHLAGVVTHRERPLLLAGLPSLGRGRLALAIATHGLVFDDVFDDKKLSNPGAYIQKKNRTFSTWRTQNFRPP